MEANELVMRAMEEYPGMKSLLAVEVPGCSPDDCDLDLKETAESMSYRDLCERGYVRENLSTALEKRENVGCWCFAADNEKNGALEFCVICKTELWRMSGYELRPYQIANCFRAAVQGTSYGKKGVLKPMVFKTNVIDDELSAVSLIFDPEGNEDSPNFYDIENFLNNSEDAVEYILGTVVTDAVKEVLAGNTAQNMTADELCRKGYIRLCPDLGERDGVRNFLILSLEHRKKSEAALYVCSYEKKSADLARKITRLLKDSPFVSKTGQNPNNLGTIDSMVLNYIVSDTMVGKQSAYDSEEFDEFLEIVEYTICSDMSENEAIATLDMLAELSDRPDGKPEFLIGEILSNGFGVEKDIPGCMEWYEKAAGKHFPGAALEAAKVYFDNPNAFESAEERGNAMAETAVSEAADEDEREEAKSLLLFAQSLKTLRSNGVIGGENPEKYMDELKVLAGKGNEDAENIFNYLLRKKLDFKSLIRNNSPDEAVKALESLKKMIEHLEEKM